MKKNNLRAYILGYPVDLVNKEGSLDKAKELIDKGGHVVTLNPEMIMQALNSSNLDEILKNADIVIPDGVGIVIALKKLGIKITQIPGIEFSRELIKIAAKNSYKTAFIGASKETIEKAIENLKAQNIGLNVVYHHDGFFDEQKEQEIIKNLQESKPQILFVALGVPKQELWIKKYKQDLPSTLMVGVGGSFDIWSGNLKRAPFIFRKFGLEWFYRLITQPSRFSRMFPTLPLFFIKVLLDNKNTRKED